MMRASISALVRGASGDVGRGRGNAGTDRHPDVYPVAGVYSAAQSVTLSCATSGATIRYTTDGSTPSETAGTVYSSAVSITSTTHLKAIAYLSGMYDSPIANGLYTIGTTSSTPGDDSMDQQRRVGGAHHETRDASTCPICCSMAVPSPPSTPKAIPARW